MDCDERLRKSRAGSQIQSPRQSSSALVFVQLYLIADFIFGNVGALNTHMTVRSRVRRGSRAARLPQRTCGLVGQLGPGIQEDSAALVRSRRLSGFVWRKDIGNSRPACTPCTECSRLRRRRGLAFNRSHTAGVPLVPDYRRPPPQPGTRSGDSSRRPARTLARSEDEPGRGRRRSKTRFDLLRLACRWASSLQRKAFAQIGQARNKIRPVAEDDHGQANSPRERGAASGRPLETRDTSAVVVHGMVAPFETQAPASPIRGKGSVQTGENGDGASPPGPLAKGELQALPCGLG